MSIADPYASGALDESVHISLVADLDNISANASIQPKWVCTPLAESVSPQIVDWVRKFRQHQDDDVSGLLLTGSNYDKAADTVSAITGALLRNFVDAQVVTTQQLYDRIKDKVPHDPTCLLIPNFFVGSEQGVKLAHWEINVLQDLILDRHMRGRLTVIYATGLKPMAQEFGSAVSQLVTARYTKVLLGGQS